MLKMLAGAAVLVAVAAISVTAATAATNVVITPANAAAQGWSTADTRPGGAVGFVADSTAPAGLGALQLTTDATTAAKAQFMHDASTPLSQVSELSYSTKQNSALSFAGGDATYQLLVCLGGIAPSCTGFTTLVFEPYWQNGGSPDAAPVAPGTWQSWDVAAGLFWSSRTYSSGGCSVTAGAGGPPFYTLSDLRTACPDAVVVGFGVSIGTYNASYDIESDLVNFNGTAYDFEPYQVATSKDQCKKDGWQSLARSDGSGFKNQGDCIQYVNTGK